MLLQTRKPRNRSAGWAALLCASAFGFAACTQDPAAPLDSGPDGGGSDAGACTDRMGTGCECPTDDATRICYPDWVEREGERICRVGTQTCRTGHWSACESVVETPMSSTPGVAVAAASDDPITCSFCDPACFAAIDTIRGADVADRGTGGLIPGRTGGAENPSMVGTCTTADCMRVTSRGGGTGTPWALTPTNSEGVTVDPADGALVLGVLGFNSPGVWVSSMDDGTVSRLDPATGREIGRYFSTRPDFANRARPANEACNWSNRGNCPSRTAVDQNFDCYVANRAFGNQGTVTRIAARLENCVDRNGNGIIDTSTDRNGNGLINKADPTEFYGVNDECIIWTVPVGVNNGVPRALAVGIAPSGTSVGDVWVGNFNERRAYRLRPSDGAALGNVAIGVNATYGAVVDRQGRIWFTARNGSNRNLGYVNPSTMTYTEVAAAPFALGAYGVAYYLSMDGTQEYIFVADWDNRRLLRYNINANNWTFVATPGGIRGLAADINGNVWAAAWTNSAGSCNRNFWRFDTNLAGFTQYLSPSASCYMGVGVTFDNAIWGIAGGGSRAARLAPSRTSWIETPSIFVSPYTYSDFIGYGLNVFANPRGHHQFTVMGDTSCARNRWTNVTWNATRPVGTSVNIFVRVANTAALLSAQPWIGPFATSPANLAAAPGPVPTGPFIEIDVRMETADRRVTPRVTNVNATGVCDPLTFGAGGTYTRVYDSVSTEDAVPAADICDPLMERPRWNAFTFDLQDNVSVGVDAGGVPRRRPNTFVEFQFRQARSRAGLAAAPMVSFQSTSIPDVGVGISRTYPNVSALFRAAGLADTEPYMEVRAILRSTVTPAVETAVVRSFSMSFACEPQG